MKTFGIGLLFLFALTACSKSTQEGSLLDSTGHHASGWVTVTGGQHPSVYLAQPGLCNECHGNDLKGGISGVSCFSAGFSGLSCHAQGPSGHPAGFAAPDVHGARVKLVASGSAGMAFCKNCHGPDYRGAGAAKDCIGCHKLSHPASNAPHSPAPWRGGVRTHTNVDPSNAPACAQCHTAGANLTPGLRLASYQNGAPGCFNSTLCHGAVGHSDTSIFPSPTLPWANPVNHGARARFQPNQNNGFSFCQTCHATDFSGGFTQVGCLSVTGCHGVPAPHPPRGDWTLASGTLSHVNTDQIDPALTDVGSSNAPVCTACHNAGSGKLSAPYQARFAASPAGSFRSGVAPGCFNASLCHGDMKHDCSVCHGYSTVTSTIPFQSLAGATSPTDAKVGAHVRHLNASGQTTPFASSISADIGCVQCHPVPASPLPSITHRNASTQILFGTLATANGTLTPVLGNSSGALTCANVYCHGATLVGGANTTPRWNDTGYLSAAGCGTCHGYPPAIAVHAGKTPTDCIGCHPHVNASGTGFTDPSKHINGVIDATGSAHGFPFSGSVHRPGGTGTLQANGKAPYSNCSGCHDTTGSAGTYPVAIGVKPLCSACHLDMTSFSGASPGCQDCHGSAASGLPSGIGFPNTAGQHGTHSGVAVCVVCHSGAGTGSPAHGNSNRTLKTANDVVVIFSSDGGTMAATRSYNATANRLSVTCTGFCHEQHNGRTW